MNNISPEKRLLDIIKQSHTKVKLKKEVRFFTKINIILIAMIVLILSIFLMDIFVSEYNPTEFNLDFTNQKEEVIPIAKEVDDSAFDIVVEKDTSIPLEEAVRNLHLLGIVTGNENQAIIEDKEKKDSFFLNEGDTIGEFTVYDIQDTKVILDYHGKKVELKI